MQMRCVGRGIAGASDVAEDLPAFHRLPFLKATLVSIEVRVVVGERLSRIELVNREPARLAREQLLNATVFDGEYFCAARRKDVERFVRA
jgi:hypothetical protein